MPFLPGLRHVIRPLLVGGLLVASGEAVPATPEYQLKARLLLVLRDYVVWPGGLPKLAPLVLGVVGASPFQDELIVAGRTRPVQVRHLDPDRPAEFSECHLLFICASETERLGRILTLCKGRPILTVGDREGYARRGVMLNVLLAGGTLHLEVNLKALRAAGLEISSAFLSLPRDKATIVEGT